MIIIVDSNEQATSPGEVEHLRAFFADPVVIKKVGEPISFVVAKLTAGDINVIPNDGRIIAFELKEPGDLLGSIGDGRIFRQVENMTNHASFAVIVVTGSITYGPNDEVRIDGAPTNWKGSAIRAAICAIEWSACPVLRTTSGALGMTLVETTLLAMKPPDHFQRAERVVAFPPLDERVEILSGFPGIGLKRARAMMNFVGHDGQMGRLADALSWATILGAVKEESHPEGWGPGTIQSFRNALGLSDNEMLSVISYDLPEGGHDDTKPKEKAGSPAKAKR